MADRVQVKCVDRKMWGGRIFGGVSGVIYQIPEGGVLRAISPSGLPDPVEGVDPADAEEFATFKFMRVSGSEYAAPAAPQKKPASDGGASEADGSGHVPDPDVNGDPGAPSVPLVEQLPDKEATVESWTSWAREHGIALSPAQKRQNKDELIATITDLAAEKDATS